LPYLRTWTFPLQTWSTGAKPGAKTDVVSSGGAHVCSVGTPTPRNSGSRPPSPSISPSTSWRTRRS
jgi:hypothetical protein